MPKEVHEHWSVDPDDPENGEKHRLTGYTIVTYESPWDDETRARAMALTEYEDSLCKCGCGRPVTESLRKQPYRIHTVTCYAGKAVAFARRKADEAHKDAEPGWDDGMHWYAVPEGEPTDGPPGTT